MTRFQGIFIAPSFYLKRGSIPSQVVSGEEGENPPQLLPGGTLEDADTGREGLPVETLQTVSKRLGLSQPLELLDIMARHMRPAKFGLHQVPAGMAHTAAQLRTGHHQR